MPNRNIRYYTSFHLRCVKSMRSTLIRIHPACKRDSRLKAATLFMLSKSNRTQAAYVHVVCLSPRRNQPDVAKWARSRGSNGDQRL